MSKFRKPKRDLSDESKVVIDLIRLLEDYPDKDKLHKITPAELALYIAQNCRVLVV